MREALTPPPDAWRGGAASPALGRKDLAAAGRRRTRGIAAQTAEFLREASVALPHYPLWDMNRGYGP